MWASTCRHVAGRMPSVYTIGIPTSITPIVTGLPQRSKIRTRVELVSRSGFLYYKSTIFKASVTPELCIAFLSLHHAYISMLGSNPCKRGGFQPFSRDFRRPPYGGTPDLNHPNFPSEVVIPCDFTLCLCYKRSQEHGQTKRRPTP